ncbi:MAG: GTPase ObgE [Deltaproteobacteria bacterium]
MSDSNFVDYVKLFCRTGKGGAGSVHFKSEKFNPKGGPDGGDGGRGGSIILKGNRHTWTLLPLRYRRHIFAGDGENGKGAMKTGASGEDIIIEVPLGTVAKDFETNEVLLEITEDKEEKVLLKGGRGGLGNTNFKSPTNQAPRYAQPGEPGIEAYIVLELKLLADVGLVGFPNAGKSTLLASVSAAKPKIANYPFTTLEPNLGIVSYKDGLSFIMADIPGIIENAHEGKGLGLRFLRHIERNSVLLFIIPVDADDINRQYKILLNELKQHNPELLDKPRMIGISKTDIIDEEYEKLISKELKFGKIQYVFFSAISGKGLDKLKDTLWVLMNK